MDMIINENDYNIICNLIELIDSFSISIYQKEKNEVDRLLISIIDKLDSIIGIKSTLVLEQKLKIHIDEVMNKVPGLLDAYENNDNLLISDILTYEIKPVLEKLTQS